MQDDGLHDNTQDDLKVWYAKPEFNYVGMPSFGKPHFARGSSPIDAIHQLARYMTEPLRSQLRERNEDDIYIRPDCDMLKEQMVCEMDGYKPDRDEWLRQKQYFNTWGDLNGYNKRD